MTFGPLPEHRWLWYARPERVIDGDTIQVTVDQGMRVERHGERLRLLGLNCPEVVGASKAAGLAARAFTQNWLDQATASGLEWSLLLETFRPAEHDSFGRWLAVCFNVATGACLNADLIASGYATPREGMAAP